MTARAEVKGPLPPEQVEGSWVRAAACTAQGIRPANEDSYVLMCDGLDTQPGEKSVGVSKDPAPSSAGGGLFDDLPDVVAGPALPASEDTTSTDCLFAVLDGHGGAGAAQHCAKRLPAELKEQLEACGRDTPEARRLAVEGVCLALDRYLRIKMGPGAFICGSTCVFCFMWVDENAAPGTCRLLLANLGDSRALVIRTTGSEGGEFTLLGQTTDHTPDVPAEEKRIKAAGGTVRPSGQDKLKVMRVDGALGCSRALGDFAYKDEAALLPEQQKVSSVPDVYEFSCSHGDAVILACDGVFDVFSSTDVAKLVGKSLQENGDPALAAQLLVKKAVKAPGQGDNCTCVVALLGNKAPNVANCFV
mmetsp:Transcript_58075/g.106825  ORF Transcript_58075/g.106825 Transcript_58075/m.106825 type:complete len:361 (-) Transcript_58075:133-1215(-)